MKGIIPTGGRGTRMRPLTFSTNKHFIPVANKPLIFYPVETLADAGIKEIAITYNPAQLEQDQELLGDGSRWGLKFTYVLQEKPAGLANIAQVCEEYLEGEAFVLHLGDNIFVDGIKEAVDHFEREKPNGLVTMVHHKDNRRLGVPYFDENGRLLKYVEKPENPPHDFAIPGVYLADSNFFKSFTGPDPIQPSARGEYEIPSPFQWLIDHGFRVDVIEYKGKWLDPGKFDDWLEANEYLLENNLDEKQDSQPTDTKILGKVSIGKNCRISGSELQGPMVIGDDAVIKDSVIGKYTSLGDGCTVENSSVENSVILGGVKISNIKQPISKSLIGTDTEIINGHDPDKSLSFFVGELCKIEI